MVDNTTIQGRVIMLKAIADETRLRILGLLAEEPRTGKQLADALQLTAPTISHHMRRLIDVGVVMEERDAQRHIYALNGALLRSVRSEATGESVKADSERARVMKHFFKDGKLTTIPANRKQRVHVLHYLLEQFEPGRQYPEKEVNKILTAFNEDYATLRRELVNYGYLNRDKGIYQVATSLPKRSRNLQQELPANEADWLRALISASIMIKAD